MLILDVMIAVMVALFYKELLTIFFDPIYPLTQNVPVEGLNHFPKD